MTTPDMHDMTAFNDTVYVAEANNHSFSIWDVADKMNPILLARVVIPGGGYVHNIWPTPDRKYLATTEETANKTMKIWNREDLSNITLVAEYLGPSNLAHNAHIEGNYLYLSHYESGVSVLDITTPECPVEVARFDTYLSADLPQFQGCWGVFPHNFNRSHRIYASNIDGRLFVFHQDTSVVSFWATPQIGAAPLNVSFTGFSPLATDWAWQFGDGDSAGAQNPTHVYPPGIFNVRLQVNLPSGTGSKTQTNFITALAETLTVSDTIVAQGASVYWEIRARNNVPIQEITLPVTLSNVPAFATFDSLSVVGCRTSYFQLKQTLLDQRGSGKFAIRLRADNGGGAPPLAPGDGPLARVYMKIQPDPPTGSTIAMSLGPVGSASLSATTLTTTYVPIFSGATAVVSTLSAQFSGTPTSGNAPLSVNFTPQPSDATGWKWSFGDGDSSLVQNPSHIYAPGLYDVRLEATGMVGTVAQTKARYITALAETLTVADTTVAAGSNVVWEIRAINHVPITDLTLPVALSNVPAQASFDSISASGCRAGYFEYQQMVFDDRAHGAAVLQLTANAGGGSPPLPPGDGAIAKIYMTIPPNAITGQKVALSMPALGIHQLIASTLSISFVPSLRRGAATITGGTSCDCHCHADPVCDGQIDVLDVIQTVNVAFRAQAAAIDPACLRERTDVDCSGSTDVLDVARVIDVAFRAADPLTVFCDACSQ
ncbi:MAG: choice-of-anchor B family protein [candidate division Zixibacteria bacterium]|nr:choice-of-anchor B family protein [candidate division Zixibacteria bacterium]